MRPSKTRLERQAQTNPYLSEMDLKQALQIQAAEKKRALQLIQLQEKADLLKHYENYALGNQNSTDEDLHNFLEKKREEFTGLDEDLIEAQEFLNKKPDLNFQKPKSGLDKNDYDKVANMVNIQSKDENSLSSGEQDRLKRLKLREEERLRRLHGIKSSAYDSENGKLTFVQHQTIKLQQEKPKNDITNMKEISHRETINQSNIAKLNNFELNKMKTEKITKNNEIIEQSNNKEYSPLEDAKETINLPIKNSENIFLKQKQMKYKDELDRQIALKQKEKNEWKKTRAISANIEDFQPKFLGPTTPIILENLISPQNKYSENNFQINNNQIGYNNFTPTERSNYRPKSVIEVNREAEHEKKRRYAEELQNQINQKKQENFSTKEQIGNSLMKIEDNNNNEILQAKKNEMDKKKRYAEELKNQIQEKKQKLEINIKPKSSEMRIEQNFRQAQSFENNVRDSKNQNEYNDFESYPLENNFPNKTPKQVSSNQGNVYFHKMEAESQSRESKRKDLKQIYQEELKQQIDEKKRLKDLAEQKLKEDEKREIEKFEKERQRIQNEENPKPKGRKNVTPQTLERTNENDENIKARKLYSEKNDYYNEEPRNMEIYHEVSEEKIPYQKSRKNLIISQTNDKIIQKEMNLNEQRNDYYGEKSKNNVEIYRKNSIEIPTAEFQSKNEYQYPYNNNQYQEEYPLPPQGYPNAPKQTYFRPESISKQNEKYVTYEEFERQTKALKEVIEEKLHFEKLNMEEEGILKEYKSKIKEIYEEKQKYENEIEKLRNIIQNHFPNQNHVDLDFLSEALQGKNEPLFQAESRKCLKGIQNHLRESLQVTESLPTKSNFVYGENHLEQSFMKDLEIFKAIHWNYFLNESHFIENALDKPQQLENALINHHSLFHPMSIQQTNPEEIPKNLENYQVPLIKTPTQKTTRTPKLFQSLLRPNTQETPKLTNESDNEQMEHRMVTNEDLLGFKDPQITGNLKRQSLTNENHLKLLLAEESEVQSIFVSSNNLDERKLPMPNEKKYKETEEDYKEDFEIEEIEEDMEKENEIQMNEAKYQNEEKSLVLADEELDEAAIERFIESNENKSFGLKYVISPVKEMNSSNSKVATRFRKPKTFDVFGKIQNTNNNNYTNEDRSLVKESLSNRAGKMFNKFDNYLDELEKTEENENTV